MKKYQVKTLIEDKGVWEIWMDLADRFIYAANEQKAIDMYKDFLFDNSDGDEKDVEELNTMICKAIEQELVTRTWKLYGLYGQSQTISFVKSLRYDFSDIDKICIIEVKNSDITHTNEYSIISITCDTKEDCLNELIMQITNGIFSKTRIGKIEEI